MHAFWRVVNSLKALLLLLFFARWLVVTRCHSLSAPAWRSTADSVTSTRRQICCTVLNFHCLCRCTHELLLFASNSCSRIVCIHIFFTCDTFPIVTALTKCSLLTNISKITSCLFTRQISKIRSCLFPSSSARLIDITVKSVLLSWYAVATINNADVKFTRYKTWGCLRSSVIT